MLVAGFISGGTEDVDGNLETTRLLRSQLRTKSDLRVIDADVLPLMEVADARAAAAKPDRAATRRAGDQAPIKEEKDLEPFEHLFADVEYWKQIGEEYQQPLIVTGTVMFTPQQRNQIVQREKKSSTRSAAAASVPVRTYQERKGFMLKPTLHLHRRPHRARRCTRETFSEEMLYNANQTTPALSSYFELMDRLIPSFLSTLSSQKIKGTRVLLQ